MNQRSTRALGGCIACSLAMTLVIQTSPTADAAPVDHVKKITAPDAEESNQFGRSVAYNGVECFIGAPERDEGGVFASGAGYFFGQNLGGTDNWGFVTKRNEFIPGLADRFGFSVGMSAQHAVAGVWGDDDNGNSAGAAYLYERNLGGIGAWGLRKKLLASDGVTNDDFGWSADMDDGAVIIGARRDNSSQGAAYIYQQNAGGADNWGQTQKLIASDPENDSFFGESVAIEGHIAVVGAFQNNALGNDSGAVYIYEEFPSSAPQGPGGPRTGIWKFMKKIVAPDGGPGALFGWSVAIQNGSVLVGAPNHLDGSGSIGAVYLFHRNEGGAGNYGFQKKFLSNDTDNLGDDFGRGVDIDGDIIVVGAAHDGAPGDSPGRLYVYARDVGGADNWGFLFRTETPTAVHGELLGFDVDVVGDTIVAGAWGTSDAASFSGAAHAFRINSICPEDLNGDGSVDTADLGIMIAAFGGAGLGDLNLDGVVDTADLGALIGGYGATDCAYAP